MTVEMDGMRQSARVLNHPPSPVIGLGDLDDVGTFRPGVVALSNVLQSWLVPLNVNVVPIDLPAIDRCAVDSRRVQSNVQCLARIKLI